ncbi:GCN5-related N-acetyltransferase [Pholiota conissans]|uniref:GCN5-related N-acetyltransferase n=1 Tax=Pholiota conissans TaxID=109636 RepID=A0A9P5YW17_9AGAR|nr:GCN5-related N-acetyltransferase [Pholiota conissans]
MANQQIECQSIKITKISKEDTISLRHSVLWPDMPPEHVILPEDELGVHYGAFLPHHSHPVAVVSLFVEACPIDRPIEAQLSSNGTSLLKTKERAVRFRKFACDPQYQGKGFGTQLLLHALSIARSELGVQVAWCDARRTTESWYSKRGFVSFGNPFFKGPVEYIRMELDLNQLV